MIVLSISFFTRAREVRDAAYKQIVGNAEIANLIKIIGLDQKQTSAQL